MKHVAPTLAASVQFSDNLSQHHPEMDFGHIGCADGLLMLMRQDSIPGEEAGPAHFPSPNRN